MMIDSLEVDRLGRGEGCPKFLGNSQFGDLARELAGGNIGAHCLEGDDSSQVSLFPLVARQPNSRGASKSEFTKDPEMSMVKGVANGYRVETAGTVIFDVLDCIKAQRNETRGHHHGSTTWDRSEDVSGGMKLVSPKSGESELEKLMSQRGGRLGWNPASNSEGRKSFVVGEVRRRGASGRPDLGRTPLKLSQMIESFNVSDIPCRNGFDPLSAPLCSVYHTSPS